LTLLQINRRFLLNFVIFAAWLAIADCGENSKSYSQEEGRAWAVFTLYNVGAIQESPADQSKKSPTFRSGLQLVKKVPVGAIIDRPWILPKQNPSP
jgi:hypothetical protein